MTNISRGELKQKLQQQGFQIATVDDISVIRYNLGHPEYDSKDIPPEEVTQIEEYLRSQTGTTAATPPGDNHNGNGKKAGTQPITRKQRANHSNNSSDYLSVAKKKHSTLITSGVKQGAKDADEFHGAWQQGFVHRIGQHMNNDAQLFGSQVEALGNEVSDGTVIDIEAILGPVNSQETSPNELLGGESLAALPMGGIGFGT